MLCENGSENGLGHKPIRPETTELCAMKSGKGMETSGAAWSRIVGAFMLAVAFAFVGWSFFLRSHPDRSGENGGLGRKTRVHSENMSSPSAAVTKSGRSMRPKKSRLPGAPVPDVRSEEPDDPFAAEEGVDYESLARRSWIDHPMGSDGVVRFKEVVEHYGLTEDQMDQLDSIMLDTRRRIAALIVSRMVEIVPNGNLAGRIAHLFEYRADSKEAAKIRSRFVVEVAEVAGRDFAENSEKSFDGNACMLRGAAYDLMIECGVWSSLDETGTLNTLVKEKRIDISVVGSNGQKTSILSGPVDRIKSSTLIEIDW